MNGAVVVSGAPAQLDGDAPNLVVLTFPVEMDRSSVELFVPRSLTATWTDDRTLSIVIPAGESAPSFNIHEARSKDGSTIVDFVVVNLTLPPSIVVSTYSVVELFAGPQPPRDSGVRMAVSDGARGAGSDGFSISPDGTKALLYQTVNRRARPSARIFDLASRKTTILSPTPAPSGPLLIAGWVGRDRLVLVGERVWVGGSDGTTLRAVDDPRLLTGMPPATAQLSAQGNYVALGWRDRLIVVDLRTGETRRLTWSRDECATPGWPFGRLAWSPDERRLASIDCAAGAAPDTIRTRILDIGSDRVVNTVEGGANGITQLLTGDFAVSRDSGERGQGQRLLWVVFGFDGTEKARHLGYVPTLSSDGRYLLDATCCAGEGAMLTDLRTNGQPQRGVPGGVVSWLRDGRVLVVTR